MKRDEVLAEAKKCICGDRDRDYGNPKGSFELIAGLWSSYLGADIKARDVGAMMVLLKVARMKTSSKADSGVDICGYGACVVELDTETDIDNIPENKKDK